MNDPVTVFLHPNSQTQCPLESTILCVTKPFSHSTLILPQSSDYRTINIINTTPGAKIFIKASPEQNPLMHIATNQCVQVTMYNQLYFITKKMPATVLKKTVISYPTRSATRDHWVVRFPVPDGIYLYKLIKFNNVIYAVGSIICVLDDNGTIMNLKKTNARFVDMKYYNGYFYACGSISSRAFIAKLDLNLTPVWVKKCDVAYDTSFSSLLVSEEGESAYIYSVGGYSTYPIISKWDLNGNLVWSIKINTSSYAYFRRILLFSGYLYAVTQAGGLLKLTTDGQVQSQKILTQTEGGVFFSDARLIVENETPYIYIAGGGTEYPDPPHYLIKYSLDESIIWQKKVIGAYQYGRLNSIAFPGGGNTIYATGVFRSGLLFIQFDFEGNITPVCSVRIPSNWPNFSIPRLFVDNRIYACGILTIPEYGSSLFIMKLPATVRVGFFPEMPDMCVNGEVYTPTTSNFTVETATYDISSLDLNPVSSDLQVLPSTFYYSTSPFP